MIILGLILVILEAACKISVLNTIGIVLKRCARATLTERDRGAASDRVAGPGTPARKTGADACPAPVRRALPPPSGGGLADQSNSDLR